MPEFIAAVLRLPESRKFAAVIRSLRHSIGNLISEAFLLRRPEFCRMACCAALLSAGLMAPDTALGRQAVDARTSEVESSPDSQVSPTKNSRPDVRLGSSNVGGLPNSGLIDTQGLRRLPDSDSSGEPRKRFEFVGAPIPIISPTIGNGIAVAGAVSVYIDKDDRKSPPSLFGGGVMFTSNGSRAYGALAEVFLKEDRFRILGAFGKGQINYDYYGIGSSSGSAGLKIPLSLDAKAFILEPKVRLMERWYAGPRYVFLDSDVKLNLGDWWTGIADSIEIPEADVEVRSAALGLRVERDSRDSQYYPAGGSVFDTTVDFYNPAFGSQRAYQSMTVSYQSYIGLGRKNVIAYRGSVCSVSERAPFYSLCMLGQTKDLRGYALGRYQDNRMIVGQAEYRRTLFWRVGAVGFMGAGEVAKGFTKFRSSEIQPGGGLGLRFTLARQSHINLRFDYAWGRDSSAFYVSLGESF